MSRTLYWILGLLFLLPVVWIVTQRRRVDASAAGDLFFKWSRWLHRHSWLVAVWLAVVIVALPFEVIAAARDGSWVSPLMTVGNVIILVALWTWPRSEDRSRVHAEK